MSGYWAAILALMAAYVGTLGQAVGAGRQFGTARLERLFGKA